MEIQEKLEFARREIAQEKAALEAKMRREFSSRGQLPTTRRIKEFALAGRAFFTIVSKRTGRRFTYCVENPKDRVDRVVYFVKVLTGQNNESDYQYLGTIFDNLHFSRTGASRIDSMAESHVAFQWFWNYVVRPERDDTMDQVEVWHEGRCCRCGRKLTVPESVESGVGPECARRQR